MSMGFLLSLIGLLWWVIAAARGGWAWLLAWVGSAFLVIGVSYLLKTPAAFGKRADGSLPIWRIVAILPYMLLTWGIWHARRLLSREPPYAEIEPGVFIGRRLTSGEWPEGTRSVLDLTSEFGGVRPTGGNDTSYRCLPILDRCAPDAAELISCLREFRDEPRSLYLHCAEGHGRTALAAAVLLLLGNESLDAEQAIARVRSVRPGARLSAEQRTTLDQASSQIQSPSGREQERRGQLDSEFHLPNWVFLALLTAWCSLWGLLSALRDWSPWMLVAVTLTGPPVSVLCMVVISKLVRAMRD